MAVFRVEKTSGYACCGISFLTTTVDTLRFSKPTKKAFLHCGKLFAQSSLLLFVYTYIINNKGGLIVNGIYVLPGSRKEMGDL